jgi:hypothetical protein
MLHSILHTNLTINSINSIQVTLQIIFPITSGVPYTAFLVFHTKVLYQ